MTPEIMKILAALLFGVSAALLGYCLIQILRSEKIGTHAFSSTSMRRAENRKRALERSPFFTLLLLWLRMPAALITRLDLEGLRNYVRKPYARAGYPGGLDDDELVALGFLIGGVLVLFIGFSAIVFLGPLAFFLGIFGVPIGFLVLVSSLQTRGEIRERQILQAMPYVLDLLVLILRAGTSLTIALGRVVEDYVDHPVGDELGQVLAEIEMGAPRAEALRRFAERLGNPDITSLSDSIAQSEELGWPLAETLQRQADRMAAERILRAQSKAGAAGVWVMLPSTLVLMAAVLLLFGPFILKYMRTGTLLK